MTWMRLILACVAAILGTTVRAETVVLRSGEHPGFTRLVLKTAEPTQWQIGRVGRAYVVRSARADIDMDASRVFDQVPRTRLSSVTFDRERRELAIDLGCVCHAVVANGERQLVLDIADGAPNPSSPYEAPMPASGHDATQAAAPAGTADHRQPSISGATLLFRPVMQRTGPAVRWEIVPATGKQPAASAQSDSAAIAPVTRDPATGVDIGRDEAPAGHDPGAAVPPGHAAETREVAEQLLRQLSRAAAQGLIETDGPIMPSEPTSPVSAVPDDMPPRPKDDPPPDRHFAFRAETSVDRDARFEDRPIALDDEGRDCVADEDVSVADWGDGKASAGAQLATARTGLVGEFDRPDAGKVAALVRLYLFLGMGAEARQTLAAFDVRIPNAALLFDLGAILDGDAVAAQSSLHLMLSCDGQVALWAFLAAPSDGDATSVNLRGLARSFSALPAHLRDQLGPRLAERLIAIGAPDTAREIRNAIARHAAPERQSLDMIDAGLRLSEGAGGDAEQLFDALAKGTGETAVKATILSLTTRLERGAPVAAGLAETIAAMAFEHRKSQDAAYFARLDILAQAAAGRFPQAAESYRRWLHDAGGWDHQGAAQAILSHLVKQGSDEAFVKLYFDLADIRADAKPDGVLAADLGNRLVGLGFAAEAQALLATAAPGDARTALILAQAELDLDQPDAALSHVAGLTGVEAEGIRRLVAARRALVGGGRPEATPMSLQPSPVAPSLAAGRAALSGSESLRASLSKVLATLP